MTHTCPTCGTVIPCDARQKGEGRRHSMGWQPTANHAQILEVLEDAEYLTAFDVFVKLSPKFTEQKVRDMLSDLVGCRLANSKFSDGKGWVYWV